MSLFIIILIIGEMMKSLHDVGIFTIFNLDDIGLPIHTMSMVFFSIMLWMRFYYSKKSGRMMIEMQ